MTKKIEVWRQTKVAEIIGVSIPTLWRMRRDGRFPEGASIGGTRIIGWKAEVVEKWIDENFSRQEVK